MARPSRSLRALVAAAGLALGVGAGLGVGLVPAVGSAATAAVPDAGGPHAVGPARATKRTAATKRPADDSPLRVTIDGLTPSYVPSSGNIVVTGTVTNRARETWTSIALYAFDGSVVNMVGTGPMRNASQLARAAGAPYDAVVGDRVTDAGSFGDIDSLEPGQTKSFTVRVPASALGVSDPGVYWFGVHAIGQSASSPRDQVADGRARTFLPYLPQHLLNQREPLPTALVMPLTRRLAYNDDGTLGDLPAWIRSLGVGGRVHDALSFGDTDAAPLTWLLDPALVDAVGHLAAGNPARSLDPTTTPSSTSSSPPPSTATSVPSLPSVLVGTAAGTSSTDTARAAAAATDWLDELGDAVQGDQVLALPYGNLDVPASLHHDPGLLDVALAQRSATLSRLGITTSPALASPGGYLDTESIESAAPGTTVLATDQMFPGPVRGLADVDDHPVVVTSSAAPTGGPGPGPAVDAVALRQRILSEAAVRLLKRDPQPLTVVLPVSWKLDDAQEFFSGLEVPWLDLETVGDLAEQQGGAAESVDPDTLVYPSVQKRRELDPDLFSQVDQLAASGVTLQNVLTDRTDLADDLTKQALIGASYSARPQQSLSRMRLAQTQGWVSSKLGAIAISAPRGVTLSSGSGKFAATITNRLDQSVTVDVSATSDRGLRVEPAKSVTLSPHSHTTVLLEAHATTNKVHNVTLLVTDSEGTPLGATDDLPIRSAQVSNVIWLIMGTGAAILFVAIGVRLTRRFARSRRQPAAS